MSAPQRIPLPAYLLPLCLLLLTGAVFTGCGSNGDTGESGTEQDTTEQELDDPIPFRPDGTLHVLQDEDTLRTIEVEIADTDSARARGLMERTDLPEDAGMLFLFEEEAPQSFWMANTPLALDIIFADADQRIVSMTKYTTPHSQEQVTSGDPAQYVLEMRAGYADRIGIIEGQRLAWTRAE
ncbi:MAG: DUF192 domain-containing protein [Bacteroidota bacterium]